MERTVAVGKIQQNMIKNLTDSETIELLPSIGNNSHMESYKGHSEDENIFRIIPFTQFLSMIVSRENTLLHPSCWEDPYERLISHEFVRIIESKEILERFNANRWYAQCWSFKKESDGLWRSFTIGQNVRSVKLTTTIKQLLNSYKPSKSSKTNIFFCKVHYTELKELRNNLTDLSIGYLRAFGFWPSQDPDLEAKPKDIQFANELSMLTLKRDAFSYEDECRLLAYHPRNYKKASWSYKADVNDYVMSIEFDPWTKEYEYDSYQKLLKERLGYKGEITFSPLYKDLEEPRTLVIDRKQ